MAGRNPIGEEIVHFSFSQRKRRAEQLLAQEGCAAADLLRFYIRICEFQQRVYQSTDLSHLNPPVQTPDQLMSADCDDILIPLLFDLFAIVRQNGPPQLAQRADSLARADRSQLHELTRKFCSGEQAVADMDRFFTLAAFQPILEKLAEAQPARRRSDGGTCPFCGSEALLSVLRPEGLGRRRSLLCSLCSTEWDFPRLRCASCGEERHQQLNVFTAEQFEHVRVEACETCKIYLKSIDLASHGLAVPQVDEIATLSLDLWAREKGYTKLHPNLLGE